MFGTHFYNEGLRKLTIAFGQLFNNIIIQNTSSTGAVTRRIRVPLAYAPKEKFIVRLEQQANLQDDREVAVTLPRLGFEITGLQYDASRKINKVQKTIRVKSNEDGKVQNFNYAPVPYNINFSLYSFTATAENGLQIIEQILPFFSPSYTLSVKGLEGPESVTDIPISLNSLDNEDSYQGGIKDSRRTIIYTLSFGIKVKFAGPLIPCNNGGLIKAIDVSIMEEEGKDAYGGVEVKTALRSQTKDDFDCVINLGPLDPDRDIWPDD